MNVSARKILAFFGLAETQEDIEWRKWDEEQKRKLKSGEEIEPPWIFAPDTEPWSGEWRQGGGEYWLLETWFPFWQTLEAEQRDDYLKRWQPPTEEWREYLTVHWVSK